VLLIPNRAIWIDSSSGRPFVERQAGDAVEIVFIEQGLASAESSEVVAGLQEGDLILVRTVSIRDRFRDVLKMPIGGQ
jgi:hypothetical protein